MHEERIHCRLSSNWKLYLNNNRSIKKYRKIIPLLENENIHNWTKCQRARFNEALQFFCIMAADACLVFLFLFQQQIGVDSWRYKWFRLWTFNLFTYHSVRMLFSSYAFPNYLYISSELVFCSVWKRGDWILSKQYLH